jgi:hypothetical protein
MLRRRKRNALAKVAMSGPGARRKQCGPNEQANSALACHGQVLARPYRYSLRRLSRDIRLCAFHAIDRLRWRSIFLASVFCGYHLPSDPQREG